MHEEEGTGEPIYLELADWILSFSAGTTPQQLAPLVRDAMRPIP